MPPVQIRSVRLLAADSIRSAEVRWDGGGASTFAVVSPTEPARLLQDDGADFVFGTPVLFVAATEAATVKQAAEAMAREMGGYWLRYYNSPDGPRRTFGPGPTAALQRNPQWRAGRSASGPDRAAAAAAQPAVRLASAELTDVDQPGSPERCCAVLQVTLRDARRFSILASTPSWFEAAFAEYGLRYYFGPQILFLRRLEPRAAQEAAQAMSATGDRWLCVYDTPRTTLPRVLSEFKSRHP